MTSHKLYAAKAALCTAVLATGRFTFSWVVSCCGNRYLQIVRKVCKDEFASVLRSSLLARVHYHELFGSKP